MFAIVEFPLSREVEPVPKIWITKDGHCWWPKYRSLSKIRQAILRQEAPCPDNFISYPARVLKYYDTYDAASADAPRAQFDSDLNSEPDTTPKSRNLRLRLPKRTIAMSSDDEEDSLISAPMPPPPSLPPPPSIQSTQLDGSSARKRNKEIRRTDSTPGVTVSQLESTDIQDDNGSVSPPTHVLGLVLTDIQSTPKNSTQQSATVAPAVGFFDGQSSNTSVVAPVPLSNSVPGNTMTTANFQAWVVRHMGILKAQVSQLQESVDVLIHGQKISQNGPQNVELDDLPLIPIQNTDQLTSFNEVLSDDAKRKAMVIKLARRGGQTLGDCVRRVLQVLLTNEFAKSFNWIGSRGDKFGFKNTSLMHLVYDAVRSNRRMDNADEKLMEIAIKDWLKNAKKAQ